MSNYNIFSKKEFTYVRTMALVELLVRQKARVSIDDLLSLKVENALVDNSFIDIPKLSVHYQFSSGFDEFLHLREINVENSKFFFSSTSGKKVRRSRFVSTVSRLLREAGRDEDWSVDDLDEDHLSLLESLRFPYKRQRYQVVLACGLMGALGTRPGEIAQLRKRDIKLNLEKIVFNKTKGQERQDLPILPDMYPFLRDYISYLPSPTSPLFVSRSGRFGDIEM